MVEKSQKLHNADKQFQVIRPRREKSPSLLANLMLDSSAPVLIYLAEQYGLRRMPGLTKQALIARILRELSSHDQEKLLRDLISARYGSMSVDALVRYAVAREVGQTHRPRPRLDQLSQMRGTQVEGNSRRWVFTIRGHEASIDLAHRSLSCDCRYFEFAARRQAICKHLARAFEMVPEIYARDALIDLIVSSEYGDPSTSRWRFVARKTAAYPVVDHP
jgi:hypothetical protein